MAPVLSYNPREKQQEFHRLRNFVPYRLFGGAAGPGKSYALTWEAFDILCKIDDRGYAADALLLRRTFSEIEKSCLKYFRRDVPWQQLGIKLNESKHVATWPGGSTLTFGHAQNEHDIENYHGGEFVFVGFDELTEFTYYQWSYMASRNRCPVPNTFCGMAGATNPGGIDHQWVKALWGCGGRSKRPAPGCDAREEAEYNPNDYVFIPALLSDNPTYANDEAYKKKLRQMRTSLFQALLNGDWNIFEGQFFEDFSQSRHVIPKESVDLKPWWPRWISGDWGYAHPACFHWHARTDTGKIITYRELFAQGVGEIEWGQRIVDANAGDKVGRFVMGGDAESKRGQAKTVFEQIGDIVSTVGIPRPHRADDARINGARLMHQLIDAEMLQISTACPNLIAQIPTMIHDVDNPEDVLKVDKAEGVIGDDAYDCARYGYQSYPAQGNKPYEVRISESVEAAEKAAKRRGEDFDINARMMAVRVASEAEKQRGRAFVRRKRRIVHFYTGH
jgi:hypothetical protein